MSKWKSQIENLRKEGKSYRKIEKILGCSRSTIAYHSNNTTRNKFLSRKNRVNEFKEPKGSKCESCGYSRCMRALEFHHIDPATKSFDLSSNSKTYNLPIERIKEEIDKCALLCSNCHREVHQGLLVFEDNIWIFNPN